MADKNQNAEVWQGQDVTLRFVITGVDVQTGTELEYGVSRGRDDDAALVSKTKGGGGIATPAANQVDVTLDGSDLNLPADDYFQELWITDVGGKVIPLADGTLIVHGSVLH